MRRMIPQKLIDELTARLEREEQTKEMLENIEVQIDAVDIGEYYINLSSDGETYLTITVWASIETTDVCTIELLNIPTEFLSKLHSAGVYLATNTLEDAERVYAEPNQDNGYIKLTIGSGETRTVFSTINLTSAYKEL